MSELNEEQKDLLLKKTVNVCLWIFFMGAVIGWVIGKFV